MVVIPVRLSITPKSSDVGSTKPMLFMTAPEDFSVLVGNRKPPCPPKYRRRRKTARLFVAQPVFPDKAGH